MLLYLRFISYVVFKKYDWVSAWWYPMRFVSIYFINWLPGFRVCCLAECRGAVQQRYVAAALYGTHTRLQRRTRCRVCQRVRERKGLSYSRRWRMIITSNFVVVADIIAVVVVVVVDWSCVWVRETVGVMLTFWLEKWSEKRAIYG